MNQTLVFSCVVACVSSGVAVAQTDVADLEARVLSGDLSPAAAIFEYCMGESLDKTQDAFCSSPDEALRLLEQRLNSHRIDAN